MMITLFRYIKTKSSIGYASSWASVRTGVPHGSILGPVFFLIYIIDLTKGLSSNIKSFTHNTNLFLAIHDESTLRTKLIDDLTITYNRVHNHLVRKCTINHLAKLAKLAKVPLQSLKLQTVPVSSKEFLDNQATVECGLIEFKYYAL